MALQKCSSGLGATIGPIIWVIGMSTIQFGGKWRRKILVWKCFGKIIANANFLDRRASSRQMPMVGSVADPVDAEAAVEGANDGPVAMRDEIN